MAQLPLDRLHEQVAVATDAAAEDDHLRVEHRGHGGDGEAQHRRLRLHDPARNRVAAPGGDEDPLRRQGRAHSEPACRAHDARRGGRLLESPAAAVGGVARVAFAKRHVRDLPGGAVRASIDVAVDHQRHPDPGPDRQEHEVVHVAAEAVGALREGREVHVVLEADVRA